MFISEYGPGGNNGGNRIKIFNKQINKDGET
jgi:hypothetical protein